MQSSISIAAPGSSDKVVCGICKRQLARYTCPTCNVPYCSLTCYRNPTLHVACTETFFRRELELESRSNILSERERAEKRREREEMMNILKRFEDECTEDDFDLNRDHLKSEEVPEDEEEENPNSLAARLTALGVAVDDANPEDIWEVLTPDERDLFLKTVKDPDAVAALSQQAEKGFENDTWWSNITDDDEDKELRMPKMIEVPTSLIPQNMDPSRHKSPLIYNLVLICLAYAHTIRLTTSPLPVPGQSSEQAIDMSLCTLRNILPFIFDRASKHAYTSLEAVFIDLWSTVPDMTPEYIIILLQDCISLLNPRLVVLHSPERNAESPHSSLLLLLSDLFRFLTSLSPISKRDKQIYQSAAFKIRYYTGQILSPSPLVFPADGVRFVVSELTAELKRRSADAKVHEDTLTTLADGTIEMPRAGGKLIQEAGDKDIFPNVLDDLEKKKDLRVIHSGTNFTN